MEYLCVPKVNTMESLTFSEPVLRLMGLEL
jgi:hypothetical protein